MQKNIKALPEPVLNGKISLEKAVKERRSARRYSEDNLTPEQLSQLLWAGQGITDDKGFRTAPSAGALYPLEIYVVKKDGLFHYIPAGHKLERLSPKDLHQGLGDAAWGQNFIYEAPVNLIICAVYKRVTTRYGDRGVRYTDIEVGHAAQNIHLQATALGLASAPVGAFSDSDVASVLGLSKEETPVYIIPVGYKR